MEHYQVLPLQVILDRGIIVIKRNAAFPKDPGLGSHHQIQFIIKLKILGGVVLSLCQGAVCLIYSPGLLDAEKICQ